MIGADSQEHGKEFCTRVTPRSGNHTAHHADKDETDDVETTVVGFARCPSHEHGNKERGNPDRDGDEKGFNVAIARCLHNSWKEVLKVLGQERGVLEEDEEIDATTCKDEHQSFLDAARTGIVSRNYHS